MAIELPDIRKDKVVAIDTETFDPGLKEFGSGMGFLRESHILGVSFTVKRDGKYHSWYIPLNHTVGENNDWDQFYDWTKDNFTPEKLYVGANILYDLCFLKMADFWFPYQNGREKYYDVLTMEGLLSETSRFSLDGALAHRGLGGKTYDTMLNAVSRLPVVLTRTREPVECLRWISGADTEEYACGDAEGAFRLWEIQRDILQEGGLARVAQLENALLPVLLGMRLSGVNVDREASRGVKEKLQGMLDDALERLGGVNPNSSQMVGIFAHTLGLDVPGGIEKPSVRKEWLEEHLDIPFIKDVYDARVLGKAISTYIDGIFEHYVHNGIIYPNFHPVPRYGAGGTETGRFSASNPNLQSIPARNKVTTKLIRGLFLPQGPTEGELNGRPEYSWIKADYSQIEYRLLAHYALGAKAEEIRERYRQDPTSDFHKVCQDMIQTGTGVQITRQSAKTLNFGMVYGMGGKKLARMLHTPGNTAQTFLASYHAAMPFIRTTARKMASEAARTAMVRTLSGRIRHFRTWEASRNRDLFPPTTDRELAKAIAAKHGDTIQLAFTHKALNTKLQGGAADIIKVAMVKLNQAGFYGQFGFPLLTVHDELDFSIHQEDEREALPVMKEIMEGCVNLKVPLICDIEKGPNWGDVSKVPDEWFGQLFRIGGK